MKKFLILAVVAVFAVSANAQYYIGGSIGFAGSTDKPEAGDKTTTTGFTIAPEFGYSLTEKVDLGITLGYSNSKEKTGDVELKVNGWEVAPYVRYSLVQFGNFNVLGKAAVSVGGGKEGEQKNTNFGIRIAPIVTYALSDKFDLFTNLNFLGAGFSQVKFKDANTVTNYGLLINADDVANIGDIQIGFVYKF
jgi:hypothetical protein